MPTKLVRDHIPYRFPVQEMGCVSGDSLISYLLRKLREESLEVEEEFIDYIKNGRDTKKVKEEMADVLQVLQSLAHEFGIMWSDVETEMANKRATSGAFTKGLLIQV